MSTTAIARKRSSSPRSPSTAGARYRLIASDAGDFVLMERSDGSLASGWLNQMGLHARNLGVEDRRLMPGLVAELARYFAGEEVDFADAETPQGPSFFRACWDAARNIPRGRTRSYAELAVLAGGNASAARAAGQAMRNNPLPVIVPCHRVIGADGRLGGFGGSCDPKGSELGLKQWLLDLERAAETFSA
jgi:methylated-DNA-[protein]-cysteine S-methyltransferase